MKETLQIIQETNILGKQIIMYGSIENPKFMASDVAKWIEHSNSRMMLKSLDNEEKGVSNVYTLGGIQEKWFITEDGLYEVCMQSRKPIAKQMKKEIKTYLKQIRLTGGYIPIEKTDSDDVIMAKALKIAEKTIKEKDTIISYLEPKAEAYDDLINAEGLMSINTVAKILEIGEYTLFTYLRNKKVFYYNNNNVNIPYERFRKEGKFKVKKTPCHDGKIRDVTYATNKGLDYIRKLIKKDNLMEVLNA